MTDTLLTAEPPAAPDPAIAPAADGGSPTASDATDTPPVPVADPVPPVEAAPELTYSVALRDGSPLSTDTPERIVAFAKAHGLSPDVAAKIPDLLEDVTGSVVSAAVAAGQAERDAKNAQWKKDALADPFIGRTPQEQAVSIGAAQSLLRRFAAEFPEDAADLQEFFGEGYGNRKSAVKLLVWMGRGTGEGTLALPSAAPSGKRPVHEVMYPEMAQEGYGKKGA